MPLAEEIILGKRGSVFLQIDGNNDRPMISSVIDLSKERNIILIPHDHGVISPIIPYHFEDEKEIEFFIKEARKETINTLYFKSKSLWKKFVVADNEQLILLAADSIFTFFQDLFAATHYTMVIGPPGSGKGAILVALKYLGYRVILASDMSGANLLDLLGSIEEGQVVIAEDELDDIDDDPDKKRLYKVGYDRHGPTPKTLDGNTSSRKAQWFLTYGYKFFAAEESCDSSTMEGFNDRTFKMKSVKGKPEFYVKELITTPNKDSKKYRDIISRVTYFRKLMLIYRMLHHKDPIKDVRTNLDGRPLELTGPQICLFSTPTLITKDKDKQALNEILPVLSSFLRQKGELNGRTLEAVINSVLLELFDDPEIKKNQYLEARVDGSIHTCYNIKNSILCEAVREALGGEGILMANQQSTQSFYCPEFGKVTHKTVLKRCRDRFMATEKDIGTGKDKTRGHKFSREEVIKAGRVFEVISEIEILPDDDNDDEQQNRTAIENDEERVLWQGWNEYIDNGGHNNNNNSILSDSNKLGTMGRKYPSVSMGLPENIVPHESIEQDKNANLATDQPPFANKSQQTTCNDINTSNNEQGPFCMDTDVQNSKTSYTNEQKIVPSSHVFQTINTGKQEEQIPQQQEEENLLQHKFQHGDSSEKDSIEVEKEREEAKKRILDEDLHISKDALEFMLSLPVERKIPKVTELETIHATAEQQEEMERLLLKKNNND